MESSFPSAWKLAALEDCMAAIIDYRGKTPKKTTFGVPLITAKIVKGGQIKEFQEYINNKDYEAWMRRGIPQAGDVIVTTEAPLGEVAQLDNRKVALAQRLITLRGQPGLLDNDYLKFLMQSQFVQTQLVSRATGTTVQGIKQSELRKVTLVVPPLAEQRAIARILGTLDDKIELNRQTNQTLEAMASALFKSWFVDFDPVRALEEGRQPAYMDEATARLFPHEFEDSVLGEIPKGWRVGTLGEECKITMGQSPPSSTYNESGSGTPFYQGRKDFGFRYPTARVCCTQPKRLAEKGDTLVSVRAPVGDINIASQKCSIGRGVAAVRHKTESRSYTYYLLQALKNDFAMYEAEGTVFGSINKNDFNSLTCVISSEEIVNKFEKITFSLDQKIENNEEESQTLANIRDTLLPKLMSGEIRVKEAEKQIEINN